MLGLGFLNTGVEREYICTLLQLILLYWKGSAPPQSVGGLSDGYCLELAIKAQEYSLGLMAGFILNLSVLRFIRFRPAILVRFF